jgi:hypothetical protein
VWAVGAAPGLARCAISTRDEDVSVVRASVRSLGGHLASAAHQVESDVLHRAESRCPGSKCPCRGQPISSTENADGGFNTESRYRLRLINYPNILGAKSQIEWQGKRYAIEGDAKIYNGSRRTAHVDYVMVRK